VIVEVSAYLLNGILRLARLRGGASLKPVSEGPLSEGAAAVGGGAPVRSVSNAWTRRRNLGAGWQRPELLHSSAVGVSGGVQHSPQRDQLEATLGVIARFVGEIHGNDAGRVGA